MALGCCPNCEGGAVQTATAPKDMKIRRLEAASGDFRRWLVLPSRCMLSKLGQWQKPNLDKTEAEYIVLIRAPAGMKCPAWIG